MQQYYQTLNIRDGASKREIHRAYRMLSKRFHPDSNSGEACTERFHAVRNAYEELQKRSFKPKTVPSEELLGQMEYYHRKMRESAERAPQPKLRVVKDAAIDRKKKNRPSTRRRTVRKKWSSLIGSIFQ